MHPRMVACNATNSSAIDYDGNIWVWGSGRYGLLGEHIKEVNYQVPKLLELKSMGETDEEKQSRDAFTREREMAKFYVKDIAMGQYHMIVVAVDTEVKGQFTYLEYADDILQRLKTFLVETRYHKIIRQIGKDALFGTTVTDRQKVEVVLKQLFASDIQIWPQAKWITLYNYLFSDLQLNFTENLNMTLEKLNSDLSLTDDRDYINLKELRDQIVGERINTNVVFGWGLNDERLCGTTSHKENAPRRYKRHQVIGALTNHQVVRVACGNSYSLALTQQGNVYSWGIGKSGSLGVGEIKTIEPKPTQLTFQISYEDDMTIQEIEELKKMDTDNEKIMAIDSGQTHCLALTTRGQVYSWGNGQGGRLGHGDAIGQNVPELIQFFRGQKIVDIVCGDQHSGCINEQGQAFIWGVGLNGRLGIGGDFNVEQPIQISEFNIDPCSRMFLGMNTSFAITKTAELYVWGSGQCGKVGLPNTTDQQLLSPRKLFTLSAMRIAEFSAGPFHTLALTYDGYLYAFGNSKEGKLGLKLGDQNVAMKLDDDDAQKEVSNVIEFPTLVTNAPKFFIQGELQKVFKSYLKFKNYTSEGVLKDLDVIKRLKVIQTACGDNNSYFLFNTGAVYATGANDHWQCSQIEEAKSEMDLIDEDYLKPNHHMNEKELAERGGPVIPDIAAEIIREVQVMQQIESPYLVSILRQNTNKEVQIKQLSAGANHVLAVSMLGTCHSWGENEFGQLGLGKLLSSDDEATYVSEPTLLKDLLDKKILMTAAGRSHSLFLTELGQVYSAGLNESGQLGMRSEPLKMRMNNEDQYDVILANYMYNMTKSTPQRVELQDIRFIAAGDSHSLAISDSTKDDVQQSELYSWGWGAFGQLGHSKIKNSYNLDKPKKVKFRDAQNTKIAFVSAGSKHTLCLDMEGKLWYFGHKLSVGIREPSRKLQFEPIHLSASNSFDTSFPDRGFVFVDANSDRNLVVSAYDNSVYYFGQQYAGKNQDQQLQDECISDNDDALNESGGIDMDLQEHQTHFSRIKHGEKQFNASIISIGPQHCIAIDNQKDLPYSWGDNPLGQLGLGDNYVPKVKNNVAHKESEGEKQRRLRKVIKQPKQIKKLADMIEGQEANAQQFQKISQNQDKSNKQQDGIAQDYAQSNLRFPIQAELVKSFQGIPSTNELIKNDIKMISTFKTILGNFNNTCKGVKLVQQTMITRAQDGLITRIFKFPTPYQQHTIIQSSIPKSISRNRQVFEALFNYLQAHPCYLIKWIKGSKYFTETEDLKRLLYAIFGQREMKDNLRVLNTLVIIAKAMFDEEAKQNKFKELCSVFRNDSPFRTIFKMIFEMQQPCIGFNKEVIARLLHRLQESYLLIVDDDYRDYNRKAENTMLHEIFLFMLDVIRKRIDLLGGIDLNKGDSNHLTLQVLSLLDYVYQKLVAMAKESQEIAFNSDNEEEDKNDQAENPGEAKRSNSVNDDDKKNGKQDDDNMSTLKRDKIFPFLLDLLFENLIDTISELSYEQILFEYWDTKMTQDVQPIQELFGPIDGESYLKKLCKYIKMYFRSQATDVPSEFQELLKTGGIALKENSPIALRNVMQINFREEIAKSLFEQGNFRPLDLDFLLVQQLFQTCTDLTNPVISCSVNDIVFVFNQLVANEALICLNNHPTDPLRVLIQNLGGQPIKLQLGKQALRMRINLQLACRFLYDKKEIIKCRGCHAPLTEEMIPRQRFIDSVTGREWRCANRSCGKHNQPGVYQCTNCNRAMPEHLFGKDLIFERYVKTKTPQNVKLFKFALKNLPMVEEGQDLVALIDTELKKMQNHGIHDLAKSDKLLKFRQLIEDFSMTHGHLLQNYAARLGLNLGEDQAKNKQLHLMLAEKDFLEGTVEILSNESQIKRQHQKLFKEYQAQLSDMNELNKKLRFQTISVSQHLDQILYNSYLGISSKFLKEQVDKQGGNLKQKARTSNDPQGKNKFKERIWAGSLHIDPKDLGKKKRKVQDQDHLFGKANKNKGKTQKDNINDFFAEISTGKALSIAKNTTVSIAGQEQPVEGHQQIDEQQEDVGKQLIMQAFDGSSDVIKERAITGTIKFTKMQQDNVLKKADGVRYDFEILKNSQFQFNDNGHGGFKVQLVYKEPKSLSGSVKLDQVVLESFEISRDILCEMRRNFACHSTIVFGMLQFRVHELVKTLNRIIAMNNIFSSLNFDEDGYQIKKEGDNPNGEGDGTVMRGGHNQMDIEISDDESMDGAAKSKTKKDKKGGKVEAGKNKKKTKAAKTTSK